MNSTVKIRCQVATLLLVLLISLDSPLQSQQRVNLSVGEVEVLAFSGRVELSSGGVSRTMAVGLRLSNGDLLETGPGGRVVLSLADSSMIELRPDTRLQILQFGGGLGELIRIFIGKVRLKIRQITGRPNRFQIHSPIATIGVRGTELEILVEPSETTTVQVFRGLVAVANSQIRSPEVLVPAGRQVTVYPFRAPDSPVPLGRLVAENFVRESSVAAQLEPLLEPAERPNVSSFLAFEDPHLDILDNPSYATNVSKPSGRFYLSASTAESDHNPQLFAQTPAQTTSGDRLLRGISAQVSYLLPVKEWTLGGLYQQGKVENILGFSRSPADLLGFSSDPTSSQIGQSRFDPEVDLDSQVRRGLILASRRSGRHSFGFSLEWNDNEGDFDTFYEAEVQGTLIESERTRARFDNRNRQLGVGYRIDGESGSLALSYRYGFITGETDQTRHTIDRQPALLARLGSDGHSQALELSWRRRLLPNLLLAVRPILFHSQIDETSRDFRIADSDEAASFWAPGLGLGLGGNLQERLYFSLDYQFTSIQEFSRRWENLGQTLLEEEDNGRHDHGLHSWAEIQLPSRFFLGGGATWLWTREKVVASFQHDSLGRRTDSEGRPQPATLSQRDNNLFGNYGFRFGHRFAERFFLEYGASKTTGPEFRPLTHALLLRLNF